MERNMVKQVSAQHTTREFVIHPRLMVGENMLAINGQVRKLITRYVFSLSPEKIGRETYKEIMLLFQAGSIMDTGITLAPLGVKIDVPEKRQFNVSVPVIKNGVVVDVTTDGAMGGSTLFANHVLRQADQTKPYLQIVNELILKEFRRIMLNKTFKLAADRFTPSMKSLIADIQLGVLQHKARKYSEAIAAANADHKKIEELKEQTKNYFNEVMKPLLDRRFAMVEMLLGECGPMAFWTEADMIEAFQSWLINDMPFPEWYASYQMDSKLEQPSYRSIPRFRFGTATDQKNDYMIWEFLDTHPLMRSTKFKAAYNGALGMSTMAPSLFGHMDMVLKGAQDSIINVRDRKAVYKAPGIEKLIPLYNAEKGIKILAAQDANVSDQIDVVEQPWVMPPNSALMKMLSSVNATKPTITTIGQQSRYSNKIQVLKVLSMPQSGMEVTVAPRIVRIQRVEAVDPKASVEGFTYREIAQPMIDRINSADFRYTHDEPLYTEKITFSSMI
jgi:hypothetical protein